MNVRWMKFLTVAMCAAVFTLAGCDGDDGNDGAPGPTGEAGLACWDLNENGVPDFTLPDFPFTEDLNDDGEINVLDCNALANAPDDGEVADAIAAAKPESCGTCHGDADVAHQSEYDAYVSTTLAMEITNVTSVAAGGGFDVTVDFTVSKDGAPYTEPLSTLDSVGCYVAQYDSATGEFINTGGAGFASLNCAGATSNGDGSYTLVQNLSYDPLAAPGGAIVGTVGNELLSYEEKAFAARVRLYNDLGTSAFVFGDYGSFESVANVEGCQKCHSAVSSDGTLAPYRKHGNLSASVEGAPDFSMCRGCHKDDVAGGHPEWQWMMDDPLAWGEYVNFGDPQGPIPSDIADEYAYDRNLFNDVHMAHAMELAYPTSMSNCATCHEGKLDQVLAEENFTAETCKSCHVEEGLNASPALGEEGEPGYVPAGEYYQAGRPPSMDWIWEDAGVDQLHLNAGGYDLDCQTCHVSGGVAGNALFSDLHSGYNTQIYDDEGNRYADEYTVSIDNANLDGDVLAIRFSANDDSIVPEVLVSLYGWDSKDFYIASHTYDGSENCPGGRNPACRMEYVPESAGGDPNALFTEGANSTAGAWIVRLDFSAFVPAETADIPTLIADNIVRKAEITITPELTLDDGTEVALNAVTQTIDLQNGAAFVDDYYKGANAIADVQKCNNCHDQLATTFHSGSGRGGDITACRNCHNVTFDGSHLEMASRQTANYVHSIHTMQYFDSDDVDFTDPVEWARYYLHIEEFFPVFTAQSCEACHAGGSYGVPDQSQSMPAVQSASYEWNVDRNIGSVPAAMTGPASMTCGGCHRGAYINDDAAGALTSFNAHTGTFGTYVDAETEDDEGELDVNDSIVYGIIDKLMTMFD